MLPIHLHEFTVALNRLSLRRPWPRRIAIAVSGGPDSVALLWLLQLYRLQQKKDKKEGLRELVALTVDHQLRSESAEEAAAVARFANNLGVRHRTLEIPWSQAPFPPYPHPDRTEAPAREARLLLFRRTMEEEKTRTLWMGHHLDDQVENVLMRGKRMREVAKLPGRNDDGILVEQGTRKWIDENELEIVRPLVGFEKSRLIATCEANSLPYTIDPTNYDPSHTPRNLIRSELASFQLRHLTHPHRLPSSATTNTQGGPLNLLYKILPSPSFSPSSHATIPAYPPSLTELHEPNLGALTLYPSQLPPSLSPSTVRSLLRHFIAMISPSADNLELSHEQLERTRLEIWGRGTIKQRLAFSPGGGVVFTPLSRKRGLVWALARQRGRKDSITPNAAPTELKPGVKVLWDGRIVFLLETTRAVNSRWTIEPRGPFCSPTILLNDRVVLDLKDLGQRKGVESVGTWKNAGSGVKIRWWFRGAV